MTLLPRAVRHLAPLLPLVLLASPVPAQDGSAPPAPKSLQTGEQTPWIYRGSDVPRDKEWQFGEMPNGLRYAVRHNGVPPGQVSIRVRIDAGGSPMALAVDGEALAGVRSVEYTVRRRTLAYYSPQPR